MPAAIRALGVTFGPALVLDAALVAGVGDTVRSLARGRRPAPAAAAASAIAVAYVLAVRPWILRWGTTPAERTAPLPGDELVPQPAMQSTMALTIDAPVAEVWPWLAQVGQDRGGFYSYEWLENLAGCRMRNADAVHPGWQHREIGEEVPLHPLHGLPVAHFDPGHALVLEGWGAFVLREAPGDRTRLLIRGRTPRGIPSTVLALLIELPHFVMQRRMMLGIRDRAEATRAG